MMRTLTPKERTKLEDRIRKIEAESLQLDHLADQASAELDRIVDQSHRNTKKIDAILDRLAEDDLMRGK
jgi:hypothetical protein